MKENAFELIAGTKYLELLAEFLEEAMNEYGFETSMELAKPDNPQIWEFAKNGEIIAVSISPHEGTLSGESVLRIESEKHETCEEIYQIVGRTVSLIVKSYSTKLFHAIKTKKGKLAIISSISKQLDNLKKEI
jgi:hypothetical protein